ncbi:MAG: HD domain-containing protein [Candidatus Hodarchaeales archaeon]
MDDPRSYIEKEFPMLKEVKDTELVEKAIKMLVSLMEKGNGGKGWKDWNMPFTLNMDFSSRYTLAHHTYWVTKIALTSARLFEEAMSIPINYDYLIVGGVLHDAGKLMEVEEKDGRFHKDTMYFKQFRHPSYGAMIAKEFGLPDEICHILLTHASEGNALYRTVEAQIIHRADFIYYGGLRGYLGLK